MLIVEDDDDAREALLELLEREGHRALAVQNGLEALNLLRSGREVSLVLLDLMMPVMDGWAFCAELRKDASLRQPPIAILTAAANYTPLPERLHDAGLFVKPVDFDKLLSLVRRFEA